MEFFTKVIDGVSSIWGGGSSAAPAADPAAQAAAAREAEMLGARDALKDKFQILDDKTPGTRASNQVSKEEFERIAGLYADIANGHSDILLDTPKGMTPEQAKAFKAGSMEDIAKIMQTDSGRELLGSLAYEANDNYDPEARKKLGAAAEGSKGHPLIHLGRSGEEHHPECEHQQVSTDWWLDHKQDHSELGHTATNKMGATSYVEYRPGETWEGKDVQLRSDVNLYHELVHALHNKRGDNATGVVPDTAKADVGQPNDELQAVGLLPGEYINENTYRSERRDLGEDVGHRPVYDQR